ncbi:MAG: hypothetical protein N3A38_15165, partial [Planctomycetota bacterium]|nr:hypothetical protein [Planctomycetota bacterium]
QIALTEDSVLHAASSRDPGTGIEQFEPERSGGSHVTAGREDFFSSGIGNTMLLYWLSMLFNPASNPSHQRPSIAREEDDE